MTLGEVFRHDCVDVLVQQLLLPPAQHIHAKLADICDHPKGFL